METLELIRRAENATKDPQSFTELPPELTALIGEAASLELGLSIDDFNRLIGLTDRLNPFTAEGKPSPERWRIADDDIAMVEQCIQNAENSGPKKFNLRHLVRPYGDILSQLNKVEDIFQRSARECQESLTGIQLNIAELLPSSELGEISAETLTDDELEQALDRLAELESTLPAKDNAVQFEKIAQTGVTFYDIINKKRREFDRKVLERVDAATNIGMANRKAKVTSKTNRVIGELKDHIQANSADNTTAIMKLVANIRDKGATAHDAVTKEAGSRIVPQADELLWRLAIAKDAVESSFDLSADVSEHLQADQFLACYADAVRDELAPPVQAESAEDTVHRLGIANQLARSAITEAIAEQTRQQERQLTKTFNGSLTLSKEVLNGGEGLVNPDQKEAARLAEVAVGLRQLKDDRQERLLYHHERGIVVAAISGRLGVFTEVITRIQSEQYDDVVRIVARDRPELFGRLKHLDLGDSLNNIAAILTGPERHKISDVLSPDELAVLDQTISELV